MRAPLFGRPDAGRHERAAATPKAHAGEACPACRKGQVVLRFGARTGKQFLGCTRYPRCRFSQ